MRLPMRLLKDRFVGKSRLSSRWRRAPLVVETLEDRTVLSGFTVSILDAAVTEGNTGTVSADFTVRLSVPSDQPVAVSYTTADRTATAGSDYEAQTGTVTFAPGEPEKTVTVAVTGDVADESDETFVVELTTPTAGALGMVADLLAGSAGANPRGFGVYNGELYFAATDPAHGQELWKYDGTTFTMLADLNPGAADSGPGWLTVYNGNLYFAATDGVSGRELWRYDGTTFTRISDITPGSGSGFPSELIVFNNQLYFSALNNFDGSGFELWRYNGSTVSRATNIHPTGSSNPASLTVFNGALYFGADDGSRGRELWRYNGTSASLVADIVPGSGGSQPGVLTVYQGALYFAATGFAAAGNWVGRELYRYGGTAVAVAADVRPGFDGSGPASLVVLNDTLYFTADDGVSGREWWRFDGTAASLVVDLAPGTANSGAIGPFVFNNELYFTALDPDHGFELWKYDGTNAALFADINPGPASSTPSWYSFVVWGDRLYFQADDGQNGLELWALEPDFVIADGQAVGTILDDDLTEITVDDVALLEGNSGTANAVFTVRLSTPSTATVTVNYTTANGLGIAGSDYQFAAGTLTFTPGQTTATVSVAVVGDTAVEVDETFFLLLSNPVNAVITDRQGIATVLNDDTSISIADTSIAEGDAGVTYAAFTVTLSTANPGEVTVGYTTAAGTATSGEDYGDVQGTLTFAPGQTQQNVLVPVYGDGTWEVNETFFVQLNGPRNAILGDDRATGTITNDEPTPVVEILPTSVTEGDSGSVEAIFTVRLTVPSSQSITVYYDTFPNTAFSGIDFIATEGSLVFNPGETSHPVAVPVLGDTLDEADEVFWLHLAAVSGAGVDNPYGTATILDNDPSPALTIADVQVSEGQDGQKDVVLTVTLSEASGRDVVVDYATANGTAQAGSDYSAAVDTLTISAGQTQGIIQVSVTGDETGEPDETFFVNLVNVQGAEPVNDSATVTVRDDDRPIAQNDAYQTAEDTALVVPVVAVPGSNVVGVLGNDFDPNQQPLTARLVQGPANGDLQLASDGSFVYTPAADFSGTDQFVYEADDGFGGTDTATVTLLVTPVNDAPTDLTLDNDSVAENIDTSSAVPVGTLAAADVDGDAGHQFSMVAGEGDADNGKFQITGNVLEVRPGVVVDFEVQPSYSVRVRVDDGPHSLEMVFTVRVTDVPEVAIDIRPGDANNTINLKRDAQIQVAILSTATFDAPGKVNIGTLTFGATGNENSLVRHPKKGPKYEVRDVNGDGRLDLVVYFATAKTGLKVGDTTATLRGQLTDGTLFTAFDTVRVISSRK